MLKTFSAHNFIHFIEPQRLEFDEGVNYIIGGNSTGKSAIFELIRRCLSNDINTTTSSFNTETGLPYVLCKFEIPPDDEHKLTSDHPTTLSMKNIYAGLFIEKKNNDDIHHDEQNGKLFYTYKILVLEYSKECMRVLIVRCEGKIGCHVDELQLAKYYTCDAGSYTDFLQEKYTDVEKDKKNINCLFEFITKHKDESAVEDEVNFIFNHLSLQYVGVLGMRSIGPLQWSRSKLNMHSKREENYTSASKRAEIISELINDDKINQTLYNSYHKAVVSPYVFRKSGDELLFSNQEQTHAKEKSILKCPEGVVEAQQVALLLSYMNYRTLTLEEPDRGMHPQMIVKLRDWIFKKVKGRTVLVISHNPAVIDHLTIDRTFITARNFYKYQISHTVKKFPTGYKKYGRVDEMKNFLFSDRILFVDGFTDKIIIEAIFDVIINNIAFQEMHLECANYIHISLQIDEPFRKFLSSIHVAELVEGHGCAGKKKRFCKELGKASYRLADGDEVKDAEYKNCEDDVKMFTEKCAEDELFVWKDGALEKVINTVADQLDSKLKKSMGIPIKSGEYKQWKKTLVDKEDEDVKSVATHLIIEDETIRFLYFLKKMHSISKQQSGGVETEN